MNYLDIDTAEDVLNAFKACQNAGEEIQLFESLAERANPPVDAFVEILRKIKLETVLALAIQAFGNITNDDVNARLKGSEDLLVMLCEQAKSGATDLIRWSAATTIEKVGFSFIDVSQYLTEEPTVIIQRIVQSNIDKLYTGRNDFDSFIRFWVYGATYELRAATANRDDIDNFARRHRDEKFAYVVNPVVEAQDIWGINQTNSLLSKAETKNYSNSSVRQVCENHLFEAASQVLSSRLIRESSSTETNEILINNQIHCLQSDLSSTRGSAAFVLLKLDGHLLASLERCKPGTTLTASILSEFDYFNLANKIPETNLTYQRINKFIENIDIVISKHVTRNKIIQDCQSWIVRLTDEVENRKNKLEEERRKVEKTKSVEIENRKNKLEEERRKVEKTKSIIQNNLQDIKSINQSLYAELSSIDFELILSIGVECDESLATLRSDHDRLKENICRSLKTFIQYNEREIELSNSSVDDLTSANQLLKKHPLKVGFNENDNFTTLIPKAIKDGNGGGLIGSIFVFIILFFWIKIIFFLLIILLSMYYIHDNKLCNKIRENKIEIERKNSEVLVLRQYTKKISAITDLVVSNK